MPVAREIFLRDLCIISPTAAAGSVPKRLIFVSHPQWRLRPNRKSPFLRYDV